MLTILILGTLLNEGSEKGEDSKKNYMNLMKKLKVTSTLIQTVVDSANV